MASPPASKTLTGRCYCHSVHFTITVPLQALPLKIHLCHCSICRYTHGSPCTFHAPLPPDVQPQFIAPSSLDKLTPYAHAESQSTRYFCSTCGCQIGDRGHDDGGWYIASAIFDSSADSDVWKYGSHAFTGSTPDRGLAALVPSIGGRKLGVYNPDTSQPPPSPQTSDSDLLAQCHCGGVSFTISRPRQEFIDSPAGHNLLHPSDKTKWVANLDLCDDCRLVDGTNVIGWIFVRLDHLSPVPAPDLLLGSSKAYRSSKGVLRTFCGTCGATVFYSTDERPGEVDVATGLLRAPEGVMAEDWAIWRTARISFLPDGMKFNPEFASGLSEGMKAWGKERGQPEEDFEGG